MTLRLLTAFALIAATFGVTRAEAATRVYDSMFVFGDSIAATGVPDVSRVSNGLVFADYMSARLGLGPEAVSWDRGGMNFAWSGATIATPRFFDTPMLSQLIDNYEAAALAGSRSITGNSLVVVELGTNDVNEFSGQSRPDFPPEVAAALATGLDRLIAAGARNIVVMGPSATALAPGFAAPGSLRFARALSAAELLSSSAAAIAGDVRARLGASGIVAFYDLNAFETAVVADPAAYGFDPALAKASCPRTARPACSGYVFFGGIHPTTAMHQAIADGVLVQLQAASAVPEPAAWLTMILGVGFVGGAARRRSKAAVKGYGHA